MIFAKRWLVGQCDGNRRTGRRAGEYFESILIVAH